MKTLPFLPLLVATSALTLPLLAEDPDRNKAEASRLMEKAAQAKSEGRGDEARRLAKQAKRLQGGARQLGGTKDRPADRRDEHFARMKREIEELRQAGKPDEAERRSRELQEQWERHERSKGDTKKGATSDKARHVMEAVRHLHAAGLHEPAEHLEQQAKRMREEAEQQRDGHSAESNELRDLRQRVRKMENEIEMLRRDQKQERAREPKVE